MSRLYTDIQGTLLYLVWYESPTVLRKEAFKISTEKHNEKTHKKNKTEKPLRQPKRIVKNRKAISGLTQKY